MFSRKILFFCQVILETPGTAAGDLNVSRLISSSKSKVTNRSSKSTERIPFGRKKDSSKEVPVASRELTCHPTLGKGKKTSSKEEVEGIESACKGKSASIQLASSKSPSAPTIRSLRHNRHNGEMSRAHEMSDFHGERAQPGGGCVSDVSGDEVQGELARNNGFKQRLEGSKGQNYGGYGHPMTEHANSLSFTDELHGNDGFKQPEGSKGQNHGGYGHPMTEHANSLSFTDEFHGNDGFKQPEGSKGQNYGGYGHPMTEHPNSLSFTDELHGNDGFKQPEGSKGQNHGGYGHPMTEHANSLSFTDELHGNDGFKQPEGSKGQNYGGYGHSMTQHPSSLSFTDELHGNYGFKQPEGSKGQNHGGYGHPMAEKPSGFSFTNQSESDFMHGLKPRISANASPEFSARMDGFFWNEIDEVKLHDRTWMADSTQMMLQPPSDVVKPIPDNFTRSLPGEMEKLEEGFEGLANENSNWAVFKTLVSCFICARV